MLKLHFYHLGGSRCAETEHYFFLQTILFFPLICLLGIEPRALGMLCVSLLLSYTPRPANRRAFVCLLEQNCSELNLHLVTIAHINWRL